MSPLSFSRKWTRLEEAYLRKHYVSDGAAACAKHLRRTEHAVYNRAQRLHLLSKPRWSEREDDLIRVNWGVHPLPEIAKLVKRSPSSVYFRGLGLGLGVGCPQGHEYIYWAAERTGYTVTQLRRILTWARVRIDRATVRPDKVPVVKVQPGWGPPRLRYVVEPADVDDAVRRWHQTETLTTAADRLGVGRVVLARLMREAAARGDDRVVKKPAGKKPWRIHTGLAEELVNALKRKETLLDAAARVGVSRDTIRRWLREAGVPYSHLHGVPSAEVDRVVEMKRLAGCKAWRTKIDRLIDGPNANQGCPDRAPIHVPLKEAS